MKEEEYILIANGIIFVIAMFILLINFIIHGGKIFINMSNETFYNILVIDVTGLVLFNIILDEMKKEGEEELRQITEVKK